MLLTGVVADLATPDIRKGLRSMEFKEKLEEFVHLSTRKYVGMRFILLLASFGVLVILVCPMADLQRLALCRRGV